MPAGGSNSSLISFFFFPQLLHSTSPPSATALPSQFLKFTPKSRCRHGPPADRTEGGFAINISILSRSLRPWGVQGVVLSLPGGAGGDRQHGEQVGAGIERANE